MIITRKCKCIVQKWTNRRWRRYLWTSTPPSRRPPPAATPPSWTTPPPSSPCQGTPGRTEARWCLPMMGQVARKSVSLANFVTLRLKVCFPIHKCYRPQLTALDWWNEIWKFTNSNTKLEFHLKCIPTSKMDEKCKYSDTFTVQAPELQRTVSPDVSATKGSRGHQTCRWTSCRSPHRRCSPPHHHPQSIHPPINLSTSVALSVRDRRNTRG